MARRVEADLLFGLLAFKHGLIDRTRLEGAIRSWAEDPGVTLADLLADLGTFHEAQDRRAIEAEVDARLGDWRPAGLIPEESLADGDVTSLGSRDAPDPDLTTAHEGSHRGRDAGTAVDQPTTSPAASARFVALEKVARGGLGEVYRALDPELNRMVALKELQEGMAFDPVSQRRFLREAELTGRLEHPGIVPIYALGRHPDGRPFYAMRFIEGQTLAEAIEDYHRGDGAPRERRGRGRERERMLDFRRLLRNVIDCCNALGYAHSRGVIHRDVKPANIMLGRFGETLLVDWGIAKQMQEPGVGDGPGALNSVLATDEDTSLTRPGSTVGTPQYMSPEQAAGQTERVGPAADIYGLGSTLYCLLVGHGPFPEGDLAAVLQRVSRGIFPSPGRLRRSVDPTLEAICLKAMSFQPEDRHASALDLAGELESWLADVRYRDEQGVALGEVRRSQARLHIERAHPLLGRTRHDEGLLWLARALETLAGDDHDLDRAVRTSLAVWHSRDKLLERTLSHDGPVNRIAFSHDGRSIATACEDGSIRLWDAAQGTPLGNALAHPQPVHDLAFGPAGRLLAASTSGGTVYLWDLEKGAQLGPPILQESPSAGLRFSPDGSRLAIVGTASLPALWDLGTGTASGHALSGIATIVAGCASRDGRRFACVEAAGTVWCWEVEDDGDFWHALPHPGPLRAIAMSQDGRWLATSCQDHQVRLWDLKTHELAAGFGHPSEVIAVEFSPDGSVVVAASLDGTFRFWASPSGVPASERLHHESGPAQLAFSPDGKILAFGGLDASVRLWDVASTIPLGPHLTHRDRILSLDFSPDARRLATGTSDGLCRCWRIPEPVVGTTDRISCWVRVATGLEFDEGDAIRPLEQLAAWELQRRLVELGGPPLRDAQGRHARHSRRPRKSSE